MLVFTIVLVVVFANYLKSTLISASYSASEVKLQEKVVVDVDLFFSKAEKQFKTLPQMLQFAKESDIKKSLKKHLMFSTYIVDSYYGNTHGRFISGRDFKLDEEKKEFRPKPGISKRLGLKVLPLLGLRLTKMQKNES